MSRRFSPPITLIAAVPIAVALAVAAGCAQPGDAPAPSITFGAGGVTPGMRVTPDTSTMPGMPGMSGMPGMPMGTVAPQAPNVSPGPNMVDITNFAFAPATLTVPVGTTVTWTNRDEEPHTVVSGDGTVHSPGLGTGATFTYTFTAAGSFDYVCSIHPFMHGTVVVTK